MHKNKICSLLCNKWKSTDFIISSTSFVFSHSHKKLELGIPKQIWLFLKLHILQILGQTLSWCKTIQLHVSQRMSVILQQWPSIFWPHQLDEWCRVSVWARSGLYTMLPPPSPVCPDQASVPPLPRPALCVSVSSTVPQPSLIC